MSATLEGYPQPGLDTIAPALQHLIGRSAVAEPYVRYRRAILDAQWAVWSHLQNIPGKVNTAEEVSETRTPLITAPDVTLPLEMLTALLTALAKCMERDSLAYGAATALDASARADATILQELVRSACFQRNRPQLDGLAQQLDVSSVALDYLGRLIGAPFIRATGEDAIHQRAGSTPARGISGGCVVCGARPTIAILDGQTGQRTLCCSLCGFGMPAHRVACPLCGACEPEQLLVLHAEQDDPHWIEHCDVCRGYVKTIDQRRLGTTAAYPVVQDTATLHLDLLAEQQGCTRNQPYVALT